MSWMELNISMPLEVRIRDHWVSFEIFKEGRHKEKLDEWLELTPCNYGMDNNLDHMLILAEALGTHIRHVDHSAGVVYQVHFQKGNSTKLCSHIQETQSLIKVIHTGSKISEDFRSELAYILDI